MLFVVEAVQLCRHGQSGGGRDTRNRFNLSLLGVLRAGYGRDWAAAVRKAAWAYYSAHNTYYEL